MESSGAGSVHVADRGQNMANVIRWEEVSRNRWSYTHKECSNSFLCYRITKLPDFTEPRFLYLGKEIDQRPVEVVKRQQNMLRSLHGLGSDWAISLRMVKKHEWITLYLLFRFAGSRSLTDEEIGSADHVVQNALLKAEYTFEEADADDIADCTEISWANEAAEIIKNEQRYHGDEYPGGFHQTFYVPYCWTATANTMEGICMALMSHEGSAAIEVTAVPTQYLYEERVWLNTSINLLKECMNGETFKNEKGKVLWEGKKLPVLKTPLDNMEKMNKQFDLGHLFLTSVRVFADSGVEGLANSFIVNSVRDKGEKIVYSRDSNIFDHLTKFYRDVNISPLPTVYWLDNTVEEKPMRAQRLNRLYFVEELSNFLRIPTPVKPGFPGFGFDTGLGGTRRVRNENVTIKLGEYQDEVVVNNTDAIFARQQLAKHGLIVGVPGSGKTTAMFNVLNQLWNPAEGSRIPFIVLEPAKTEYRALKLLPGFKDDMLVFSLGDESVSPFRFNPMEVLPGIKLENHMSKLQACFTGAFDLFDPLPIFLEQAIRRTYSEKGWYEDSKGGDPGVETPTLSDLCRNAEYIVSHSGFDPKTKGDFQTSLLERLNSLRRGSKGRMLDTPSSIPMEELMGRPVVLELDSLNGDEKSLLMMFLLTYVFEYCKVKRKSGSPLRHMLLIEEAHNLIPASGGNGSDHRANPKEHTIELFVNMLAEMRALGQGILIADQLPTAIAPQAVKQTNVKVLMRVTAKDDREEIGNTMDLNEEQMHQVVNFKTGHAYLYHEGEDRVRLIRMVNFKEDYDVEEPPTDEELREIMESYEKSHTDLFKPFPQCVTCCNTCDRRVRNQAESFVKGLMEKNLYKEFFGADTDMMNVVGLCQICMAMTKSEAKRITDRYGHIGSCFGKCVYIHMNHLMRLDHIGCTIRGKKCSCNNNKRDEFFEKYGAISK